MISMIMDSLYQMAGGHIISYSVLEEFVSKLEVRLPSVHPVR